MFECKRGYGPWTLPEYRYEPASLPMDMTPHHFYESPGKHSITVTIYTFSVDQISDRERYLCQSQGLWDSTATTTVEVDVPPDPSPTPSPPPSQSGGPLL
jgi:hypothetical protein